MRKAILLLALSLLLCPQCFVFAAELDENTGDQTVTINYSVDSTWTITVPATITIPTTKVAEYEITAEGSITNAESIRVRTSDSSITLNEVGGANTLTAEFRNTSDGVATRDVGFFNNENTEGNTENAFSGKNTFNQTMTRYIVITDEVVAAGTYQGTCTFTANLQ